MSELGTNPPAEGTTPPPTTPPPTTPPPAAATGTWRDSLPEDLKGNASLAQFTDVNNLAKSYVEAQKLVGKKGVFPPDWEKSTDEEKTAFFKSIGQPEFEKFDVKLPKDQQVNEDFVKKYKELAHKTGLLPTQAQSLMDWYIGHEKQTLGALALAKKTASEEAIGGLKKEWGEGYDKNLALAKMAVREVGGQDFLKYLDDSGEGNNPQVIKMLAKVGKLLGEDKVRGISSGGFGSSPAEIRGEIDKMMSDVKGPYFDPGHPGHKQAVAKMEGLYQKLSG